MVQAFKTNITKWKLFSNENSLLLALSGGMDSMVLADLLIRNGYKFSVAHCNFQLRAEESERDEEFVSAYCEEKNIPIYTVRFDARDYAEQKKVSLQMAARDLRYNWFRELMEEYNYDYLLTAHHLDDNIETFFINLLRGSGLNGLKGIEKKNNLIVRPLLPFSREQLEKYAKENQVRFVEDSSNREDKYLRNYLRHHLIPQLKQLNPAFTATFRNEIHYLQQANEIISEYIAEQKKKIVFTSNGHTHLRIAELKKQKSLSLVLFEILKEFHFNSETVEQIEMSLDAESGRLFYSEAFELLKDREDLIIREITATKENEAFSVNKDDKEIPAPLNLKFRFTEIDSVDLHDHSYVAFDADKLIFPLTFEKWKRGDKFRPLGMKGFKKLSDFFTSQHMSVFEKESQWLLKSQGEIVWVVDRRIDDRYKVTGSTKNCFVIESK